MLGARKQPHVLVLWLALVAILLMGAAFRFYNVNWDKGTYHIHPDERHTTMVLTRLEWPRSLGEYFDTSTSRLNPRNVDMVYFYGTLPLFLTKLAGTALGMTDYDQIHLVGRVLSALFDLGTVMLVFALGRRLFGWRVGLIAAFLLGLAVLHIQGSHYFAVDTFLTFFVTLTLWFTLDVAEGRGWPAFFALGLSMGFTIACKVSVFLLVIVVILGAWLGWRQRIARGQEPGRALARTLAGLSLAGLLALMVFRVAQPYAWAGPNYDDYDSVPEPWGQRLRFFEKIPEPIRAVLMPNPQWVADIVSAGSQQTGEADLPWGRQWTERTPWLYPLENMVLWGLGVPLGVAAWAGVTLATLQLVRARRRDDFPAGTRLEGGASAPWVFLLLAWVLMLFAWQGAQYVKSIRYFLPIYPGLAVFAANLMVAAWDWAAGRGRVPKIAAGVLGVFVLGGTLAWAFAFIQIYREPVTRVQATRWMYENIETAATLHTRTPAGESGQVQIAMPASHVYLENGVPLVTPFRLPEDAVVTEVVMNRLAGAEQPSRGVFEVRITGDQPAAGPGVAGQVEAEFGVEPKPYVVDLPDTPLVAGQTYYLYTAALEGAPLISQGSVLANEHFDDPLPFAMDGRAAFAPGGPYRSLEVYYPGSENPIDQLPLYDEDNEEKLLVLLDALDQADYIIMSSGRLYTSIPRLPMRYPMTTRYYELLFAEKLGFEKAAEFHSYPRLFGVEFNDDRAEEQFTVYDHPKVLIYRKTDAYNRQRAWALLSEGIDWANIAHWLNPRDVPRWKRTNEQQNDLLLTPAQREVQEQGGTWASLFDRNSLANRWPTATWYLLAMLLGLITLPLAVGVLHWLPDRGVILARPIGVLLLAWLSWILTNLTPLRYSRGTILLALGLIAAASAASLLLRSQRRRLFGLWRTHRRLILATEGLFLAFFALFWFIRWANPDLWHPWMGGEKPMDLAYLNAVIKSTEFPPYDPWFAGGYLNYYYFGQVMVGTLIKLTGIVPAVAYNLALPLWFAMTATGAFSVTYNLVVGVSRPCRAAGAWDTEPAGEEREPALGKRTAQEGNAVPGDEAWDGADAAVRPFLFGVVGALFVAVLGNLGEVHLLLLKLGEGVMETFRSTIPGLVFWVRAAIGSFEVVFGGKALPIAINEWYWNASRAIPSAPAESVITEFPFFTFLYADLHAHLIALPLTFISLSIALALVMKAREPAQAGPRAWLSPVATLLLWALTIGAMRVTNTWDVPPHLIVAFGALAIAASARWRRLAWQPVLSVALQLMLLFVLSWSVLYAPFWASYASYYTSLELWTGTRTVLWAYLVVHGLFLFPIITYLIVRTVERGEGRRPDPILRRVRLTIRYRGRRQRLREVARIARAGELPVSPMVWVLIALLILLEVFFLLPGRVQPELAQEGVFAYRGLAVFALGLPVGVLGLLLLSRPGTAGARGVPAAERLWVYLVLLALAMSLGVEVIVLQGDIGRMNTVFKFYIQVWLMWGVAAAAALAWLLPRVRRWQRGQTAWALVLAVLICFAALYPPLATSAKVRDRFDPDRGPGLDGWGYMQTSTYHDPAGPQYELKWDLEAIRWMLDNVVGSPVILEGHAPEYRWGARYSINTGLPTVLGWNWHQRQQRAAAGEQAVWERVNEIADFYDLPDPGLAMSLLEKYDVRYVVVGPLERAYYQHGGLEKFERMVAEGWLHIAFRNQEVTLYEVAGE